MLYQCAQRHTWDLAISVVASTIRSLGHAINQRVLVNLSMCGEPGAQSTLEYIAAEVTGFESRERTRGNGNPLLDPGRLTPR